MEDKNIIPIYKSYFLVAWIAYAVIFISLAAFIGALYNISFLESILPSWINMKVNTTLCFLLSGFVLLLLGKPTWNLPSDLIATALTILILLISGITLIEYVAKVDLGIDQLMIKDMNTVSFDTFYPGRMAFISAINFMLIAIAFLMILRTPKTIWVIQTCAWLIVLISIISMVNYLYGATPNSVYAKYTTMAMHTMLLFLLISTGILLINPDTGFIGILLRKNSSGNLLRRVVLIPLLFPITLIQVGFYLEHAGFIDAFAELVINQIGIIAITGILIVLVAMILDRREKDLKEARTQVLHNEMIFRQFADNIEIVFYTSTPDLSKILYVSPAYEKIWGESCESLYKNPTNWLDSIIPEDKKRVYDSFFPKSQQDETNPSAEFQIKRPDGTIRTIFSRIYKVNDEFNHVFVIIGIAVDITQISLEKRYNKIRYNLLRLTEGEKNLNNFFHKALQMISFSLDMELSELWLIDESKHLLRCVDTWHKDTKALIDFETNSYKRTFNLGEGLPGRVWELMKPLFVSDFSVNPADPRFEQAQLAGLNSAFGTPIIYQNKIYGVMNFFSNDIKEADAALLDLMEHISKSIGEYIAHSNVLKELENTSRHDFLTGLLNRSTMEEDIDRLIADKKSGSLAIIVLDIDRFKLINEALGHNVGDLLLKSVATRLSEPINELIAHHARLGADKFIIYLPDTNRQKAYEYSKATQTKFKSAFEINTQKIYLSVSIGITLYPQDGLESKSLVINADLALLQAKERGGNRIHYFTKELPLIASTTMTMESDLRQALKSSDQLFLQYQPQIDLKSGAICGAEALVRWKHPEKGLIYPDEFIPFAEKNNLIVSFNEYVLQTIFQQISLADLSIPISINISAQQLVDGFHIVEFLESLMHEFSILTNQVELEITENMLIEDTEHNIAVLTALHELGFHIAIDDFGTGFSSFNYLNRLPVNKIKIDRSFISGLPTNLANVKIVKAVIALIHSLDKIVVAEGPETKAEIDFLKQEHCDIAQGFYYYKPMSFDDLVATMAKHKKNKKQ